VSEDAGIEPRQSDALTTRLNLVHKVTLVVKVLQKPCVHVEDLISFPSEGVKVDPLIKVLAGQAGLSMTP
jgi:hypothetical protein